MTMNLILGLLPLIAFVIIDAFLGLKSGLIAAILFAVAEAAYTIYEFGELDWLSIASLVLVLVFGLLSFKSNNAIYMKLQPVFLGISFGCVVLVLQILGKPILLLVIEKYGSLVPAEMQINANNPLVQKMLSQTSLNLGMGLLLHAALVAYAAFRMSNWWWLFIRGIGLYVMMGICVLMARVF
jgi:intracellular septation protein